MAQAKQNGTELERARAEAKRVQRITRPRADGGDPDLEWLIECSAAALGERGTLAGVVGQCERGSVGGSTSLGEDGSYVHIYTDAQLGIGGCDFGEIERQRWLMEAWFGLGPFTQGVLLARYGRAKSEYRSDSGYGASTRYVEGSDHRSGEHQGKRTGDWFNLGQYAGLVFSLCEDPAKLLTACSDPYPVRKGKLSKEESSRRVKLIGRELERAIRADKAAHDAWFEAKAKAAPPRSVIQRRKETRPKLAWIGVNTAAENKVAEFAPKRLRVVPAAKKWTNPAIVGDGFGWALEQAQKRALEGDPRLRGRTRIANHIGMSFQAVARAFKGEGNPETWAKVAEAARALGFPPPSELKEKPPPLTLVPEPAPGEPQADNNCPESVAPTEEMPTTTEVSE